jgi:hypothetical protein
MSNILSIVRIIYLNIIGERGILFDENINQKYRKNLMLTSAVTFFFKRVFGNKKDVFLTQNLFIMILKTMHQLKNPPPSSPFRRGGAEGNPILFVNNNILV